MISTRSRGGREAEKELKLRCRFAQGWRSPCGRGAGSDVQDCDSRGNQSVSGASSAAS
jgi:hypothetical protein